MKKLLFTGILLLLGTLLNGAELLRLADATCGADTDVFLRAAVELSVSGKLDAALQRMLPSEALALFDAGKVDAVIIDRRFAGKRYFQPLCAEALVIYVSNVNPGANLNKKQILQILLDGRPSWRTYNFLDMDIQRIAAAPNSPAGTLINRVFGDNSYAREIFRVDSLSAGFAFTNSATMFFGQFTALPPVELKMLPVNGIMPSSATILSGEYPLALRYILLCRKDSAAVKLFMETLGENKFRRQMQDAGLLVML